MQRGATLLMPFATKGPPWNEMVLTQKVFRHELWNELCGNCVVEMPIHLLCCIFGLRRPFTVWVRPLFVTVKENLNASWGRPFPVSTRPQRSKQGPLNSVFPRLFCFYPSRWIGLLTLSVFTFCVSTEGATLGFSEAKRSQAVCLVNIIALNPSS